MPAAVDIPFAPHEVDAHVGGLLSSSLSRLNSIDAFDVHVENAKHTKLDVLSMDILEQTPLHRPEAIDEREGDVDIFACSGPFCGLEMTGKYVPEPPPPITADRVDSEPSPAAADAAPAPVHISAVSFSCAVDAVNEDLHAAAAAAAASLDTAVSGKEHDAGAADASEAQLPPTVQVLLRGVSLTLGFEDCLTVAPPEPELEDLVEEEGVPESLTLAAVAEAFNVQHVPSRSITSTHASVLALVDEHGLEDTFCVVDLATVKALYDHMVTAMPRVKPHFAVKCLPDRGVISTLAALGAGFDCASTGEVELVRELGVPANRIILAHPVKRPIDLRCIAHEGIQLTTFDSESELHKIKAARLDEVPGFAVVLRIRADDPKAKMQFGSKYGAGPKTYPRLLQTAKVLGLKVAGVSFHVGSGSMSPDAYDNAISAAKDVFDMAVAAGHPPPTLLDIGGGFTSSFVGTAGEVSEYPSNFGSIAAAIDRLFPLAEYPRLRCISEPGRYFAGASVTLAAMVYGKRESEESTPAVPAFDYWITDGVYGNFNNVIYDWAVPEAFPLRAVGDVVYAADAAHAEETREKSDCLPIRTSAAAMKQSSATRSTGGRGAGEERTNRVKHKSTVFGPTCDSVDVVMKGAYMPELQNGDWLLFPDSGAYSRAGACDFNGIAASACRTFYVWADRMEATADEATREAALIRGERPALELHKL